MLAIAAAGLLAATLPQPQTFRAGVEIVDVDVSVLDKHRLPVTGLTAADFTVTEDGKPRPIVAFTPVELAPREIAPAPWMSDVIPDTQTNSLEREGRLVVVLLDRAIALMDVQVARDVAEAAIAQLRPADLAAVVYTEYGMPQNFTSDRRLLLAAVRTPSVGLPEGDTAESGPCYCGTCTLERITDIANGVRDVRQRRKVLFIVGSSIPVTGRGSCGATVGSYRDKMMRAIAASNLTVYQFDPSGIPTLMSNASSRTPPRGAGMSNLARLGNLRFLPEETGGRAVFGNQPETTLPEIFRESNSYYVLGFSPAHSDGRFHDIRVKVGRAGMIVQARRGYYAAGAKPAGSTARMPKGVSPGLYSAIAGLWPRTDLPLTLTATPVAMPGLRTGAAVLMLATDAVGPRNVMVGAFDRNGQSMALQEGTVPPGSRNLIARLELRPGKYEIRAAVEDTASGAMGSVYSYVDIPNFVTQFVSMSGIFLHTLPSNPASRLGGTTDLPLPIEPSLRREFSRNERVAAFADVYQGLRRPAMPGYVLAEIRNDRDVRVFHQETRTLASDVGVNRAIKVNLELPLDELAPGPYMLGIEIRQGNQTARRELRFAIK